MKKIVAKEIIEAKIIKDYTVEIIFNDLKKGVVDLRQYLGKGIFKELVDKNKFRLSLLAHPTEPCEFLGIEIPKVMF